MALSKHYMGAKGLMNMARLPDFEPLKRNRKWRKLKKEAVPSLFMAPELEPPTVETRRSLDNVNTECENLKKELKDLKMKFQSLKETNEYQRIKIEDLEKINEKKEIKDQKKFDEIELQLSALPRVYRKDLLKIKSNG